MTPEAKERLKGGLFATWTTALIVLQGFFVGHLLGPWGGLVSFPLGFVEGYIACSWLLRKARRL